MEENLSLDALIRESFALEERDVREYSPLSLAYIGDGIYDLIIRSIVISRGNAPVAHMHHRTSHYVKASAQSAMIVYLRAGLTEEEYGVYKRGRNAKSQTTAKNASVGDYRRATGFEALMGYLYLTDQTARMLELVRRGIDYLDEQDPEGMENAEGQYEEHNEPPGRDE